MCKKVNYKSCNVRIDKCIKPLIEWLNIGGHETVSSCCGHGKYPLTIVTVSYLLENRAFETISQTEIPRGKRFYKKDKQGYYYIPEVLDKLKLKTEHKD